MSLKGTEFELKRTNRKSTTCEMEFQACKIKSQCHTLKQLHNYLKCAH